jgi:mono-ADP-ribosyltransferase sirtuin 6
VAELCGNTFVEICDTCGHSYKRDYDVQRERETEDKEHFCEQPNCSGSLNANVSSSLKEDILQSSLAEARQHMQEADLCLCLGISDVSPPVAELLTSSKKRSTRLVLVTLHRTVLERHADLRIHALCDDVMFLVMQALNLDIPSYITTISDNQTIEIAFDHYTFQGTLRSSTNFTISLALILVLFNVSFTLYVDF